MSIFFCHCCTELYKIVVEVVIAVVVVVVVVVKKNNVFQIRHISYSVHIV